MKVHIIRAMNSFELSGSLENWLKINEGKIDLKSVSQVGPSALVVMYEQKEVVSAPVPPPTGPTRKIQQRA